MNTLDGKALAHEIEKQIAHKTSSIQGRPPTLAFLSVGNNPSSSIYLRRKQHKCREVGFLSIVREFSDFSTEKDLISEIETLNQDKGVDGILIQQPFPPQLSTLRITSHVDPSKDVDGFHPLNIGKLLLGDTDGFVPCTPKGILALLMHYNIQIAGKHVVIVGRSNIVGKPLAALLMQKAPYGNATVTIAHAYTKNLQEICRSADILVSAAGTRNLITAPMVTKGAVIIDVGINRIDSGEIVGDVDFKSVSPLASYITPVPGGIGPMTIAMLLANTLISYQKRETLDTKTQKKY